MPAIQLTGQFGFDVGISPDPISAIEKYFNSFPALLLVLDNARAIQDVTLEDCPPGLLSMNFTLGDPDGMTIRGTQFSIVAEAAGTVKVTIQGALFDPDPYGDPIPVPTGKAYLSLGIRATVRGGVEAPVGAFAFGFDSGAKVLFSNSRLFNLAERLDVAVTETLRSFVIPGEFADLSSLAAGSVVRVQGSGSLQFSATANLLTILNPLATVPSAILAAPLHLADGGSVAVTALVKLTGEYEIRIYKVDARTLRLGYYRKHGSDFGIQVSAQLGLSADANNSDAIADFLRAMCGATSPDAKALTEAGLTDAQSAVVVDAINAAVEKRLELSLQAELDLLDANAAAFLYEIDLSRVNAAGQRALDKALDADLTELAGIESSSIAGIQATRSIFTTIHEGKHSLKINLLGIYNYLSAADLIVKGTIAVDGESGEIVITDQVNASRIGITVGHFARDSAQLRKVLAEGFLTTAVYRCSRTVAPSPDLECSLWHFDSQRRTSLENLRQYLDLARLLGLISDDQERAKLTGLSATVALGSSTFYASASYDDELAERLFVDGSNQPRRQEEYERIGRNALGLLLQRESQAGYRLRPVEDEGTWEKMKSVGQPGLAPMFPDLSAIQLAVVTSDYTAIMWWAKGMAEMANSIAAIRRYTGPAPVTNLEDGTFKSLREQLDRRMAAVAADTHDHFAQPWGLLAMDLAADSKCKAEVRLCSHGLTLSLAKAKS
ncbi:MAG: hypothetical protein ACRD18_04510 [Terriglobia bacterium]